MLFTELPIKGAWLIEPNLHEDERGAFGRTFCAREFRERGLADVFVQCSTSWNAFEGTLRGMHYQLPPSCEIKLVRCTAGALWDVVLDLRPHSPTFLQHTAVELSAEKRNAVYIPMMCAHGFQTLTSETEVYYQMSEFYSPEMSRGVRYNDPRLDIKWPLPVTRVSDKDQNQPLL